MFYNDPYRIEQFMVSEFQIIFPLFLLFKYADVTTSLRPIVIVFVLLHLVTYCANIVYWHHLDSSKVKSSGIRFQEELEVGY
jgi:hypothetical protein